MVYSDSEHIDVKFKENIPAEWNESVDMNNDAETLSGRYWLITRKRLFLALCEVNNKRPIDG
jgi:hypothetical protein